MDAADEQRFQELNARVFVLEGMLFPLVNTAGTPEWRRQYETFMESAYATALGTRSNDLVANLELYREMAEQQVWAPTAPRSP